ncbi:transcription factor Adf-1-like isoform X2 [Alosa sapidissima]|uniref:transcription factor Adf-1-like isoform X2 n=1 Tax=Alosa sapidissima TaxID=34773 RepID=UPI001C091C49|nr:transcription factor Adf-1-like isoform X2 [Alosa sapidissima]
MCARLDADVRVCLPATTLQGHNVRLRFLNKMDIEFDEKLCEEVRRYPHLYNPSLKQYKDLQACNKSWWEISQTLGREEILCRNKWKYLRDRFVKAKKKLRGRSSDDGNVPRMFSLLSWLSDYVNHRDRDRDRNHEFRRSTRGNSTPSLLPVTPSPAAPPTAGLPPVTSASASPQSPLSPASSVSTGDSPFSTTSTSRKRKSSSSVMEDALLRLLQQNDRTRDSQSQREEQRFGMMVADMLAKLPVPERMEAQFEIYQLLYLKQKKVFEKDQSQ